MVTLVRSASGGILIDVIFQTATGSIVIPTINGGGMGNAIQAGHRTLYIFAGGSALHPIVPTKGG